MLPSGGVPSEVAGEFSVDFSTVPPSAAAPGSLAVGISLCAEPFETETPVAGGFAASVGWVAAFGAAAFEATAFADEAELLDALVEGVCSITSVGSLGCWGNLTTRISEISFSFAVGREIFLMSERDVVDELLLFPGVFASVEDADSVETSAEEWNGLALVKREPFAPQPKQHAINSEAMSPHHTGVIRVVRFRTGRESCGEYGSLVFKWFSRVRFIPWEWAFRDI